MKSAQLLLNGFFVFLTVGLFLGDGKQPLIDTLASVVILSLYIYARYYLFRQKKMPERLTLLWGLILGYLIVRTVFSDSVGYSVTTTMRFVMGYLVFSLFYEYYREALFKYFVRGLILFSLIAMAAAGYFMLLPHLSLNLPLMNLLYANYGHNHLANVLVIVYPLALSAMLNNEQKKRNIFLVASYYLLVTISLLLTFSRGAIVLIGLYTLAYTFLRAKKQWKRIHIFIFSLGALLVFIVPILFFLTTNNQQPTPNNLPKGWLERQTKKPELLEGRIKYVRQAWKAISERPLFGSGPGTFSLASKRFQEAPNDFTWFAHNSILQWLVELGIVGTGILLLLLFIVMKRSLTSHSHLSLVALRAGRSLGGVWAKWDLLTPIFLILLNSLFDFNLDFLIIWLLLWALLGMLNASVIE